MQHASLRRSLVCTCPEHVLRGLAVCVCLRAGLPPLQAGTSLLLLLLLLPLTAAQPPRMPAARPASQV